MSKFERGPLGLPFSELDTTKEHRFSYEGSLQQKRDDYHFDDEMMESPRETEEEVSNMAILDFVAHASAFELNGEEKPVNSCILAVKYGVSFGMAKVLSHTDAELQLLISGDIYSFRKDTFVKF